MWSSAALVRKYPTHVQNELDRKSHFDLVCGRPVSCIHQRRVHRLLGIQAECDSEDVIEFNGV